MSDYTYCVHPFAWTSQWNDSCLGLIDRAKQMGFDMIEIPLLDLDLVNSRKIRERLERVGLAVCASTACWEEVDPTGETEAIRAKALEHLKRCIRLTAEMGGRVFTGVTYSAIGRRIDKAPGEVYWDRAATVLKAAAKYAQTVGVTVGIEAINRYETFLVNTGEQALRLMEMIDEPNAKVHLDAYHMNIEEDDFYEVTLKAVPHLCHFHLSESHRGTPGTGRVDWEGIYCALHDANYKGMVGMESFVDVAESMRAATCIWRQMAPSSDHLLKEGLRYLKSVEAKVARAELPLTR